MSVVQKHRLPFIRRYNVRKCKKATSIAGLSGAVKLMDTEAMMEIGDTIGALYYTLVAAVVEISDKNKIELGSFVRDTKIGTLVKGDKKSISHYEQSAINFEDVVIDEYKSDKGIEYRKIEIKVRKAIMGATNWLHKAQMRSAARAGLMHIVEHHVDVLELDVNVLHDAIEGIWLDMRAAKPIGNADTAKMWVDTGEDLEKMLDENDSLYGNIALMLTDIEVWVNMGLVDNEVLETARITVLDICGQGDCDSKCNNCVFFPDVPDMD